jgi:hypothetical protein
VVGEELLNVGNDSLNLLNCKVNVFGILAIIRQRQSELVSCDKLHRPQEPPRHQLALSNQQEPSSVQKQQLMQTTLSDEPRNKPTYLADMASHVETGVETLAPQGSGSLDFTEHGSGGIRTHGRFDPTSDFESGAFNHSATLPDQFWRDTSGWGGATQV